MTAIKLARLRLLIFKAPEPTIEAFVLTPHGNPYAAPSLSAMA
jgi:hypothetical protein